MSFQSLATAKNIIQQIKNAEPNYSQSKNKNVSNLTVEQSTGKEKALQLLEEFLLAVQLNENEEDMPEVDTVGEGMSNNVKTKYVAVQQHILNAKNELEDYFDLPDDEFQVKVGELIDKMEELHPLLVSAAANNTNNSVSILSGEESNNNNNNNNNANTIVGGRRKRKASKTRKSKSKSKAKRKLRKTLRR